MQHLHSIITDAICKNLLQNEAEGNYILRSRILSKRGRLLQNAALLHNELEMCYIITQ